MLSFRIQKKWQSIVHRVTKKINLFCEKKFSVLCLLSSWVNKWIFSKQTVKTRERRKRRLRRWKTEFWKRELLSLYVLRWTSFFGSCDNPINACLSCIMRFIFLVIFFPIIRTRASARANNYEKKMTRKINLIMHSETYVN